MKPQQLQMQRAPQNRLGAQLTRAWVLLAQGADLAFCSIPSARTAGLTSICLLHFSLREC